MIPTMLQIATLRAEYRAGTLTPEAVATEVLERIRRYPDPAVWIARVDPAELLARAKALDPALIDRLPLYGIPFAVKDNIDAAGLPTTAACPDFAYQPAADAVVVARLIASGAMLVGKTNLDQFATGLVGTRSPYGAPRSVFDPDYVSGGSSSGSAVAVAAGLVSFALGTDTAGSGRVPAAFNNIVGLKPTKGWLSTTGVVPACRSLDCVSVFAASSADALAVAEVAAGFDQDDPFSRVPATSHLDSDHFRFGILVGADAEFFGDAAYADLYEAAIARCRGLGGEPVPIDYRPFRETAALLYEGPFVAERLAAIEAFYQSHAASMDPTVRQIIGGATERSAVEAFRAAYRLRSLERAAGAEWQNFDVMLLPTAACHPTVAEVAAEPIAANSRLGLYTNFVNLLDYSAIAVPAGFRPDRRLPFGVTLIGPAFADRDLAVLASRLHGALGLGAGISDEVPAATIRAKPGDDIVLAVAGAHLSGLPLNHQLIDLGAKLIGPARTAATYRLFALPGTTPPKPGLVRSPGFEGPGIEIELWSLTPDKFGRFVASIPPPMGIGQVTLEDGSSVAGFLCEAHALEGAEDITSYGGWRAYLAG
jgi:allophanate hydrolase